MQTIPIPIPSPIYCNLPASQQPPPLLHAPQTPLTVPTIPLHPLFHLVSLALLRRALEQLPDFTTLVRLVQKPICVLCFYDFLFNTVDDAQGDEEVVAVGSEVLACAVQALCALCGGFEEGVGGVCGKGVVEELSKGLVAAVGISSNLYTYGEYGYRTIYCQH